MEGNYEEMSTTELSGGARIHYIFQEIFVRGLEVLVWPLNVGGKVTVVFYFILNQMEILMELELVQEVDPCDVLTDEDIRTAIQNATGPKNVLFVPEVQFKTVLPLQWLKSWCNVNLNSRRAKINYFLGQRFHLVAFAL